MSIPLLVFEGMEGTLTTQGGGGITFGLQWRQSTLVMAPEKKTIINLLITVFNLRGTLRKADLATIVQKLIESCPKFAPNLG